MSWICPRPWMVARAFSVRSSFHRTGTPCFLASATHSSSSAYTLSFEPNAATDAGGHDPHVVLGDAEGDAPS